MQFRRRTTYKLSLFSLGFLAMSVQILFIREALAVFHGNELVIGLCLGIWMLLTGIGSYGGSLIIDRSKKKIMPAGILLPGFTLLILAPFFMPWAMVYLKSVLLPAGVEAGLSQILILLLASLTPFCLVSGAMFSYLAGELSGPRPNNLVHTAYALDSAGSIFGGIIFSILIFNIQHSTFNIQHSTNASLYPGQEVLESRDTPYGRLTVTRMGGQLNLYENGNPILLAGEPAQREEMVHYALLLHPAPEKVLMISGGIGGTIEEVFKYPGVQVYYVENNPWIIDLVNRYIPFPVNDRLSIIKEDPRRFLQRSGEKFDVILLNTPDPGSAELNRFYTKEFFALLKGHLNPDGIISCSIPAAGNYMSGASLQWHSVLYNTLAAGYNHIRIIPGMRDYYLASDAPLEGSLWKNLENTGVPNLYVNPGYINEELMNARASLIISEIKDHKKINSDLKPYVYFQVYRQWLDKFGIDYRVIPAVMAILVLLAFVFLGPLNLGLFAGGFTSSSLEFILILWLQVLFGNVYQLTGIVFAVFMAGMAIGAAFKSMLIKDGSFNGFLKIQGCMAAFSLIIAGLQWLMPVVVPGWLVISLVFILIAMAGLLMGSQFSKAVQLRKASAVTNAGQSFSADMAGASIGILLVSIYLVPVLGLQVAGLMIAALNILTMIVLVLKNRSFTK